MLAPQWFPDQTGCTETLFIKCIVLNEFMDDILRLTATVALWYVSWICSHSGRIEVCGQTVEYDEDDIRERI